MADLLAATSGGGGGEVEPNAKGETLMHIAAAAPNSDRCLRILLSDNVGGGSGVNCRNKTGKSPLHLAAVHGESEQSADLPIYVYSDNVVIVTHLAGPKMHFVCKMPLLTVTICLQWHFCLVQKVSLFIYGYSGVLCQNDYLVF